MVFGVHHMVSKIASRGLKEYSVFVLSWAVQLEGGYHKIVIKIDRL